MLCSLAALTRFTLRVSTSLNGALASHSSSEIAGLACGVRFEMVCCRRVLAAMRFYWWVYTEVTDRCIVAVQ